MKEAIRKNIAGSLKKKGIDMISLGDPDVGAIVKHRIPTSSRLLNAITGGGIPCARLTEIYGEESNGKSSLGADILGNTQKIGGTGWIIDSEQAFDPARAAAMGVDVSAVQYFDDVSVEDAFQIMDEILEGIKDEDEFHTIIWDSVAASPTNAELEGDITDQAMAAKARILSKGLRRLISKLGPKTALVFINQVRSKIGGMAWGKPTEAAGGFAIRFSASIRIELARVGQVKVNDKPVGIKVKAQTLKNKTFPPFKNCEYEMMFVGGINDDNAVLDILVEKGVVTQSGSWYQFGGKKFMRKDFKKTVPEEAVVEALKEI